MRFRWGLLGAIVMVGIAACASSSGVTGPQAGFDCSRSAPATGELAADIVGQWTWIQNASPQWFTFGADGTAVRTWTSDEHDDVTATEHEYAIDQNVVAIRDYGAFTGSLVDGVWATDHTGSPWTRCGALDEG